MVIVKGEYSLQIDILAVAEIIQLVLKETCDMERDKEAYDLGSSSSHGKYFVEVEAYLEASYEKPSERSEAQAS